MGVILLFMLEKGMEIEMKMNFHVTKKQIKEWKKRTIKVMY